MSDSPADAALIRRFLKGEEAAFRALYERHSPKLKMTVRRLLGFRQQEMGDVVQETWLAACRGLGGYRGDAPFGAWLTAIGARTTYATLSRLTSRDESPMSDDYPAPEADVSTPAMDVERALDALPDAQRMVVVLHDIEGFTHHEIAEQLGRGNVEGGAVPGAARAARRAQWRNAECDSMTTSAGCSRSSRERFQ